MVMIRSIVAVAALGFTQVNAGLCKPSSISNSNTFDSTSYGTLDSSTLDSSTPGSDATTSTSSDTASLSTTTEATSSCADECARGVAGTDLVPATSAARLAKCYTYLRSTETASTPTVYVTETEYSTFTKGSDPTTVTTVAIDTLKKRSTATSTVIPTYASACAEESDYRSACFCIGASITTYIEENADTVTSTVMSTSVVTIEVDSPPIVDSSDVVLPTNTDWLSDYEYYEFELPTFTALPPVFTFPPAEPDVNECVLDAANLANEFFLLDANIGYLYNRKGKPSFPVAPNTEAEAREMQALLTTDPPLCQFEKVSNAPDGVYDLVLMDGDTKRYIAKKADSGEVVFATESTQGTVQNGIITTVFSVSCTGYLEIIADGVTYTWTTTKNGAELVVADETTVGTVVTLPRDARTPINTSKTASKRSRTYAQMGAVPRCPNTPDDVIATLKSGARGNNPNGCGGKTDVVPDWNFGRCCDGHDNCYDDCSKTFETCNDVFLTCMHGKCRELLDSFWTSWLYNACSGMADFYFVVVSVKPGADAFRDAHNERCECTKCRNSVSPKIVGLDQGLCNVNGQPGCTILRADDNNNCGGCDYVCPSKSHCSSGNCACNDDHCGSVCLSFKTHPRNCGGCGNVCSSGYCYQGTCWEPPAVIDRCFPTDGVTNGQFTSSATYEPWTFTVVSGNVLRVPAIATGPLGGPGIYAGFATAGEARISQSVHICPGTQYEISIMMGRVIGSGSCPTTITLGGRVIVRNIPVVSHKKLNVIEVPWGYGPFQVAAFNEGDAGTSKGDNLALNVQLTISTSCGEGYVSFNSVSLYAA
ncbi:hypothetical protein EDB80DRAFT_864055 [Ilyonectria destructans]|nr:hypothetical protein EDB80DRAFT_864055 [Ilyonectria destructans]